MFGSNWFGRLLDGSVILYKVAFSRLVGLSLNAKQMACVLSVTGQAMASSSGARLSKTPHKSRSAVLEVEAH